MLTFTHAATSACEKYSRLVCIFVIPHLWLLQQRTAGIRRSRWYCSDICRWTHPLVINPYRFGTDNLWTLCCRYGFRYVYCVSYLVVCCSCTSVSTPARVSFCFAAQKPRWLASSPAKRHTEILFLAYSPFWMVWALGIIVPFKLYEVLTLTWQCFGYCCTIVALQKQVRHAYAGMLIPVAYDCSMPERLDTWLLVWVHLCPVSFCHGYLSTRQIEASPGHKSTGSRQMCG